ncbi:MAG: glycine betaine/L-proline ABC transporter ATP-binding protein [Eubacteriales bacterium]|nr:glycine betaine/L-proline ABC transporter ATP-binding protein [Christensenellaceae bacterium]MEA5066976.1 glycine betaine/L-proline ABC transporter ATP-binding protein [Eubacteriales bacterium]
MDERLGDYIIEVRNLTKLYGAGRDVAARMMRAGASKDEVYKKTGATVALWDVNLKIKRGEIFVIIGLSGSGKSTAVRCLNRLNKPSSGSVLYEGRDIMKFGKQELLELRRTRVSMVFQSFGLMSHRDVLGNVAYGLEVRGQGKAEREAKAREMIEMVGLKGWEHQSTGSLSGGMRQRVGIARALANDPEVLLMDEPFSALDPLVRQDMQFELLKIQRKLGKTVVFITHDIDEAFKLGDTVAIMEGGRVVQVDTPEQMSANPANEYVRRFIDSADRTKVTTVRSVMMTPTSLARITDRPAQAVGSMRRNALSTVYVVDGKLKLCGILSISEAIRAHREGLKIADVMETTFESVAHEMTVHDILPLAAQSRYPLAVLDEEGRLMGIVTKAAVLSSMINEQ